MLVEVVDVGPQQQAVRDMIRFWPHVRRDVRSFQCRHDVTASDGAVSDQFGITVSISGDHAIIGAVGDDDAGNSSGAAYLFARDHGGADNWGELRKLTASDAAASDQFGTYSIYREKIFIF